MRMKILIQMSIVLIVLAFAAANFFTSDSGLFENRILSSANDFQKQKVNRLKVQCAELKKFVSDWKSLDLPKEKLAREELCMSFTNELIYVTPRDNAADYTNPKTKK